MKSSPSPLSSSRFRTIKTLGQGSFGTAFLVEDLESFVNNKYVIKKIDISKLDPKARAAALGEVEVLSRLSHPNIVAYYGSWIEGEPNHLHILLEFCDSGDLSQAIRSRKDSSDYFDEQQITSWFVQLSSAILFCHRMRILHRDLKTSNIFLHGPGQVVKLADFGIARVLQSEGSLASTVIGTPYYMSPELVNNESYSYKSDVWALGCVLYEMATLKHAFDAGNMCALVMSILRGKYTPLSQNQYSSRLAALIDSMLQLEPSSRPNMEEVLATTFVQEALVFAIQNEEGTGRLHVARAHSALAAVPDAVDTSADTAADADESIPISTLSPNQKEEEEERIDDVALVKGVLEDKDFLVSGAGDESTTAVKKEVDRDVFNDTFFDETTNWSVGPTADHSAWAHPRFPATQTLPNLQIDVTHKGRLDNKIKPPSLERFVHNLIRQPIPVHKAFKEHQFPEAEMIFFDKRLKEMQEATAAKESAFAAASIAAGEDSGAEDPNVGNEGWGSTSSDVDGGGFSSRTDEAPEMSFPKVPYAVSYPTSSLTTLSEIQTAMESIKQPLTSSNEIARVFMFVASRDITSSTISQEDRAAILAARAAIRSNILNKDDINEILSSMPEYSTLITPAILQERFNAREELKRQRTARSFANMIEEARETNRQIEKLEREPAVVLNERAEFFLSSPPRPRTSRNVLDEDQEVTTLPAPTAAIVEEPALTHVSIHKLPPAFTTEASESEGRVSPSLLPVVVTVLGRGRRVKAQTSMHGEHPQPTSSNISPPLATLSLLHNVNNLRASMIAATLVMDGNNDNDGDGGNGLIDGKIDLAESTLTSQYHSERVSDELRPTASSFSDQLVRTASEEKRFWSTAREMTGVSRDSTLSQSSPRLCNEARALVANMIEEEQNTSTSSANADLPLQFANLSNDNPASNLLGALPLTRLVTVLTLPEEPVTLPSHNSLAQNRQLNVFSAAAASSRSRSRSPCVGTDASGARSSLLKPMPAPRRTSLAGVAWTTAQSELASAATHLQIATNLREMVAATTATPLQRIPLPPLPSSSSSSSSSSDESSALSERVANEPPLPTLLLAPTSNGHSIGLPLEPSLDRVAPRIFRSNRSKPRRHSTGSSTQAKTSSSSSFFSSDRSILKMSSHTEGSEDDDDEGEEEEASSTGTTTRTAIVSDRPSLLFDEARDRKNRMNSMRERCIRELGGVEKFNEIISTLRTVMQQQEEEEEGIDVASSRVSSTATNEEDHPSKVLEQLIAKHGALLMARLAQLQNQDFQEK